MKRIQTGRLQSGNGKIDYYPGRILSCSPCATNTETGGDTEGAQVMRLRSRNARDGSLFKADKPKISLKKGGNIPSSSEDGYFQNKMGDHEQTLNVQQSGLVSVVCHLSHPP